MNSYKLVKNENGEGFKLKLGENEILIKVGAVSLNFRDNMNGGLAEYMVLPADAVVLPPSTNLPIAALTAYHSLIVKGNLSKDHFVLIQGTGGVSLFAVQIVHAIGAKSIVLTSSNEKSEKVKNLGADFVINHKELPNWSEKVLEITNGVVVDQILEVVGGDNISKSIDAAKREIKLKWSFDEMNQFLTKHSIKPTIEKVYQFEKAEDAYSHLKKGAFGKIVIKI
ncbi:hypothetical protein ACTFIU_007491 [Dictyostelium citrinum]